MRLSVISLIGLYKDFISIQPQELPKGSVFNIFLWMAALKAPIPSNGATGVKHTLLRASIHKPSVPAMEVALSLHHVPIEGLYQFLHLLSDISPSSYSDIQHSWKSCFAAVSSQGWRWNKHTNSSWNK